MKLLSSVVFTRSGDAAWGHNRKTWYGIVVAILISYGLCCLPAHAGQTSGRGGAVSIAAIFARTGIAAESSTTIIDMVSLAVEQINKEGGILGRPVKLLHLDNQSTPLGSYSAALKAVKEGVSAVIGSHWSSHSLAMADVLQEASIPMITPTSTNPQITRERNYIFRTCFLDSRQGAEAGRYAAVKLGAETAAILRNVDETYSIALGDYFQASFEKFGGRIVYSGTYRGNATDFSELIAGVGRYKPELVYIPGYKRDAGLFIKQARAMGLRTIFMGGDGWEDPSSIAGEALNGSFKSTHYHPDCFGDGGQGASARFAKSFGRGTFSLSSPLAWDAVMLLRDAVERAGTTEGEAIREALVATRGYQGVTGTFVFDENGDPLERRIVFLEYEDGWRVTDESSCL